MATIIDEHVRTVEAEVEGDRLLVLPADLPVALGWELKPEGLCQGDVCVPVRDRDALFAGERLDVAAVAAALGRSAVVDGAAAIAAIALPSESRRRALDEQQSPPFTLDDLEGHPHSFDEFRGRKKLLFAFASW